MTLTKLAELVANIHGELAFVEGLLAQVSEDGDEQGTLCTAGASGEGVGRAATGAGHAVGNAGADAWVTRGRKTCSVSGLPPGAYELLRFRQQKLIADRDALYATVRQFDPELAPEGIGAGADWKLQYGRRGLGAKTLVARYGRFWLNSVAVQR
jgi:hypothetical protein